MLAAADGIVQGARDGMQDVVFNAPGAPSVKGRECGNGVNIKSAEGWTQQYCHLRRGSVRVKTGDRVSAGDPLGQIGLSGQAEFPHVHLQVKQGDTFIDPFGSVPMAEACGSGDGNLWASATGITYEAGGIMSLGIIDEPADYDAIKLNSPHLAEMRGSSPAIVIWAHFYGLAAGDELAYRAFWT